MGGVKDAILSVMNQLSTVADLKHIRVWNNQLDDEQSGKIYDYPKPAAFVETRIPNVHAPLGGGYSQPDITFVIHLIHEQYDAGNGTFEQDLQVFDIKAKINAALTGFKPTSCGNLMRMAENADYNHNNLYHYQIEYLCGLVDTEGVQVDTLSIPPNNFIVDAEIKITL